MTRRVTEYDALVKTAQMCESLCVNAKATIIGHTILVLPADGEREIILADLNFVYFVVCGDYVKIGTTTDVRARITALRTSSPYDIALTLTLRGGVALERELHKRFRAHHHRLEWFRYSDEIKDFIAAKGVK